MPNGQAECVKRRIVWLPTKPVHRQANRNHNQLSLLLEYVCVDFVSSELTSWITVKGVISLSLYVCVL